jgi:hypothetical protein
MKMNPIKAPALLIVLAVSAIAGAQSVDYSSLERRFVKTELTNEDTAAFRRVGEQKVRQLFDKGDFYSQNANNLSNQAYVKQQIPDLFYVSPGDSLDVDSILRAIEKAKQKTQPVELITTPKSGYLGMVQTVNSRPEFIFHLVLMQIPKQFGKEEEMVWQVFLHEPEQRDVKVSKVGKKSGRE